MVCGDDPEPWYGTSAVTAASRSIACCGVHPVDSGLRLPLHGITTCISDMRVAATWGIGSDAYAAAA